MSEQRIGGTTGSAQIPNRTTHITGWGHEVPAATLTNAAVLVANLIGVSA